MSHRGRDVRTLHELRPLWPVALFISTFFAGCAEGAGEAEAAPAVRDSAGIRIVESATPRWTANGGWQIGEVLTSIGTVEGSVGQQLDEVRGPVRLPDGTIVIANNGSGQLFRYDAEGTFVAATGGRGDGPDEFTDLTWIGRNADSILVWDRGKGRVTVHAADGGRARDYRPVVPEHVLVMSHEARGSLSGGRVLLRRGPSFLPTEGELGLQRQPVTGWLVSLTGEPAREFGPFPGETIHLREGNLPGAIIRAPVLLGAATVLAAGADRVYAADNEGYDIHAYDAAGTLIGILRRPHEPAPVRPEDFDAEVDARLESLRPNGDIRAGMRALLEAVPRPEWLPAIRSMRVDSEGLLWVEAVRRAGDPVATWSVFDPVDGWLGDVALDAGLEILDIGADYVLVLYRDELDVEYVRLMRLRRSD